MRAIAVENLTDFREKRALRRPGDYGMAEAFAKIVRRDFPAVGRHKALERQFKVTPAEARALDMATASKRTLDRIMRNPRNFGLWLECLCDVSGVSLEQYIEQQALGARNEREQAEQREQHLARLEARWRARTAEPPRPDR